MAHRNPYLNIGFYKARNQKHKKNDENAHIKQADKETTQLKNAIAQEFLRDLQLEQQAHLQTRIQQVQFTNSTQKPLKSDVEIELTTFPPRQRR